MVIYTLVSIDLSNFNLILSKALEAPSISEAKSNVVSHFAHLTAKSSLDTFFLVLLVSLGNLSDSRAIVNFCKFSCLLLASNFFIFITLYPALLSLILQVIISPFTKFLQTVFNFLGFLVQKEIH